MKFATFDLNGSILSGVVSSAGDTVHPLPAGETLLGLIERAPRRCARRGSRP